MKPVTISEAADGRYWIKRYEFEGMEADIEAVALMPDGDIMIAGHVRPELYKDNGYIARLDRDGNVKWVRILGGNEMDIFKDVKVTPNGDIIVAGVTDSFRANKYKKVIFGFSVLTLMETLSGKKLIGVIILTRLPQLP